MTNFSFFAVLIFVILKHSLALWNPDLQLKNLLKGNCRLISPRVCKSISGFNPDYHCGFILRHVCYGQDNLSPDQYLRDKNLHVTPLPRSIHFYDIDRDGVISLKEFARTLGHDPHELHVKVAFFSADRDGNKVIDHREFRHNDVWVFERRRHVYGGQRKVSAGRRRSGNADSSEESIENDVSSERVSHHSGDVSIEDDVSNERIPNVSDESVENVVSNKRIQSHSEESFENDVSNKRIPNESVESSEDLSFEHFRTTSSEEADLSDIDNSKKSRGGERDDNSAENSFENEALFSSEEKEDETDEDSNEGNNIIEKGDEVDESHESFEKNSFEKDSHEMSSMENLKDNKRENDASIEVNSSDNSDELGELKFDHESSEKDVERDDQSDERNESTFDDTSTENDMDLSFEEKEIDGADSKEESEKRELDDSDEDKGFTNTKNKNKDELKLNEAFDLKGFTKKKGGVFRHSLEVMKNVVKALAKTTSSNTTENPKIEFSSLINELKINTEGQMEYIKEEERTSKEPSVIGPSTLLWVSVPSKRSRPSF